MVNDCSYEMVGGDILEMVVIVIKNLIFCKILVFWIVFKLVKLCIIYWLFVWNFFILIICLYLESYFDYRG